MRKERDKFLKTVMEPPLKEAMVDKKRQLKKLKVFFSGEEW